MPKEDLADAIETLSGDVQHAVFSALDSEQAAEVLLEAEPRAQRQLIANVRRKQARTILSEMSVPQLADLFSVLPHDQMSGLMEVLPNDQVERIKAIITDLEASAAAFMSSDFITAKKTVTVTDFLKSVRGSQHDPHGMSYVYIVDDEKTLIGVVDLREIVLAKHATILGDPMTSPVVLAQSDDRREDLAELFARYQFHMIPVLDERDQAPGSCAQSRHYEGARCPLQRMKTRYATYQANSDGENRALGIENLSAHPCHVDRNKVRKSVYFYDR